MGVPEWIEDSRFSTAAGRVEHRSEIYGKLKALFVEKSNAQWEVILKAHDVPYGPVNSIEELLDDANVKERCLLEEVGIGPLKAPIRAVKYSAFDQCVRKAPPKIGEDTEQVLRDVLGKSATQIKDIMGKIIG
jgi:crotonobetainyl-CoA:carnitine CoA-transferase CaiB-like acyl-CoA transferase